MVSAARPRRMRRVLWLLGSALLLAAAGLGYLAWTREFPLNVGSTEFRLRYGNRSVRSRAARDLLEGRIDLRLILEALEEDLIESRTTRQNAVGFLSGVDREESDTEMFELFFEPDAPSVEEAIPVLLDLLGDEAGSVRRRAALVLGGFGPRAGDAVPALIVSALEDWSARKAAIGALIEIGPEARAAVPALEELRQDPDASVAAWATYALMELAGREYPADVQAAACVAALENGREHAGVRMDAAATLAELGPRAEGSVPAIVRELKRRDCGSKVRLAIARALGRIRPRKPPPEAIETLIGLLRTADGEAAAAALEEIDPQARGLTAFRKGPLEDLGLSRDRFVRTLVGALKDPDPLVRNAATYFVRALRPSDSEAAAALEEALDHPDAFVRRWAAEGLKRVES